MSLIFQCSRSRLILCDVAGINLNFLLTKTLIWRLDFLHLEPVSEEYGFNRWCQLKFVHTTIECSGVSSSYPSIEIIMFFKTKQGNSNWSSSKERAKTVSRFRLFSEFGKRNKSTNLGHKGSGFSWDEASYECQSMEDRSGIIDRIPTAIEYISSSSNDNSLETDDERLESLSRYSVPMEINDQLDMIEKKNLAMHYHHKEDNTMDKYSLVDEDNENFDEDDDKSTLFGSLENDSFMSDTALRDEINIEREKIKRSYMLANEHRQTTKESFFNISACFGHISTNSRKYYPESPQKQAHTKRFKLESDQIFRLD